MGIRINTLFSVALLYTNYERNKYMRNVTEAMSKYQQQVIVISKPMQLKHVQEN